MNILQIVSSIGFFGAENVIIQLAKELCVSQHCPFVGIIANSNNSHVAVAEEAKKSNLKTEVFPCKGKLDIGTILKIRQFIKENKIHIIHSHGYKSNFYGILASLNLRTKRLTTCHNWIGNDLKMKFYEYLDKIILTKFDKVIAVSDALRDEIIRTGICPDKVAVINNGVDINKFDLLPKSYDLQFKKKLGCKEDDLVVATIGRLTLEKGHTYLLRAFKNVILKMPNAKLLIVGDGLLKNQLELEAERLKLGNEIIFTGSRNDIPEILNIVDIFVMPSLEEQTPMALLEAMASKTPLVATKVGAIPQIIQDGYSGLLVQSKDILGLSNSIIDLLQNKDKAGILAQKAYERVTRDFSAKMMAQAYIETYSNLINEN